MTICFPYPRPLCDLPRPHLQMLLYIQRTKPSSSILPMIRMPRMLQQLVEFPAECSMPQSIAGPRKCCTIKIKCHPRSVSYPSRKSSATIRAPARLPSQPRLIQFWDRGARPRSTVAKLFFELQTEAPLPRIVTLLGLVPFGKNHGAPSIIVNSG